MILILQPHSHFHRAQISLPHTVPECPFEIFSTFIKLYMNSLYCYWRFLQCASNIYSVVNQTRFLDLFWLYRTCSHLYDLVSVILGTSLSSLKTGSYFTESVRPFLWLCDWIWVVSLFCHLFFPISFLWHFSSSFQVVSYMRTIAVSFIFNFPRYLMHDVYWL